MEIYFETQSALSDTLSLESVNTLTHTRTQREREPGYTTFISKGVCRSKNLPHFRFLAVSIPLKCHFQDETALPTLSQISGVYIVQRQSIFQVAAVNTFLVQGNSLSGPITIQ